MIKFTSKYAFTAETTQRVVKSANTSEEVYESELPEHEPSEAKDGNEE